MRATPRFTHDIDIAVLVDDDGAAEGLVHSLMGVGYQLFTSLESDATGRLATVRLVGPVSGAEDVLVDLLFASSGIEPEIARAADTAEVLPGLVVPIAARGHLIALKLLARSEARLQDSIDLQALLEAATPDDIAAAREAIRLITERGYARGRDLEAGLAEVMALPRGPRLG